MMTDTELAAAIDTARASLPWTAIGGDHGPGAHTICPGCGDRVSAPYTGPAEGRANAVLVAYAAHLLMECRAQTPERRAA